METAEQRTLDQPDETRSFPTGRLDLVTIGGGVVGRLTLEPGWRWSEHGSEFDARPGDVTALPSGHDAWVAGDDPVVVVDWQGATGYGR